LSVAKIDVDISLSPTLLAKFLETRKKIIEEMGLTLAHVRHRYTGRGMHFWFHLAEELTEEELCDLQFLLGDDQVRAWYNYLRLELGGFKWFNALFSRKFPRKGGGGEGGKAD